MTVDDTLRTEFGDAIAVEPLAEDRPSTAVNAAFPDVVRCLPGADSPAVYLVTNLNGSGPDATPAVGGGQHWHTDIEFEPEPLSTSMFFAHHVPTTRATSSIGSRSTVSPPSSDTTTRTPRVT